MTVLRLTAENFRNLKAVNVEFHPNINFVVGANGSGKSSLLEALFYLGHGKSFRTKKSENIANLGKEHFVVSVKDHTHKQLGVSRNVKTNDVQIRIDGTKYSRLSELVKNIAVQIITPESFKLFFGGAKERRKFVDLGLFHVKHQFSIEWREFSKTLKQRNACLRTKDASSTLNFWTSLFCKHSIEVANSRSEYISKLTLELNIWIALLLPALADAITVQYLRGWSKSKALVEVLSDCYDREINYGYSLFGAHKFDVQFLVNKQPIDMMLSRGQQKLFLLALTFAQANLIKQVNRVKPILLIDDVGAELDINSRTLLANAIKQLDCQVIITAIEENVLSPFIIKNEGGNEHKNYKMFHVEHGQISVING